MLLRFAGTSSGTRPAQNKIARYSRSPVSALACTESRGKIRANMCGLSFRGGTAIDVPAAVRTPMNGYGEHREQPHSSRSFDTGTDRSASSVFAPDSVLVLGRIHRAPLGVVV